MKPARRTILGTLVAGLVLLAAPAAAQVTVSGNLRELGVGPATNATVVFELQNYGGNIPGVLGVGKLSEVKKEFTPDASGNISGSVYGNDVITPAGTFTRVCIFTDGRRFRCADYNITGSTFNLNSAVPITTLPVVSPPTGDTTYIRRDGGNSPIPGSLTFEADLHFKSGVPWFDVKAFGAVGNSTTDDTTAIQAAINAAAAAGGGTVYFPRSTGCSKHGALSFPDTAPIDHWVTLKLDGDLCPTATITMNRSHYALLGNGAGLDDPR